MNEKLVKSIARNLSRSNSLVELTIVGINLSVASAEQLNQGILKSPKLSKLRLNFCLLRKELVYALLPSFCSPTLVPLTELNLAANGMTDHDCADLFTKIITAHAESRDEVYWKYGLRNELPPASQLVGIKKLDLSFNKLGSKALFNLSNVIRHDRYILAINLRANLIDNDAASLLVDSISENKTLFCLDIRDNL